jgi:glycyl-tRNA synthetase
MSRPLDFQTIIMNLQRFWAEQGCLIWQPYYTQVGAGTYNPATYLRVLGPEPWNVAYVEPSVRPDDGRYGENPNRLQQHYQFQVILKPDPGNPQEIYLRSLEALGIDPRQHDIRFVEDNWESPALGAWGLGWEVWLDGQEITQFTYFQQAGGIVLEPVSVEITYGLERIAIALQRVRNFRDILWNADITYGQVNLQGEQEHSKYYFEIADIDRARQMMDLFQAEALNALDHGLVLPAHDYVLKCSHTFNILDTRGAIGVTERAAMFSRMRELSAKVARAYLEQRQILEYPLLPNRGSTAGELAEKAAAPAAAASLESADLLFEIGSEELPAGDLDDALQQLRQRVPQFLADLRLDYTDLKVFATPRRLTVLVENLAGQQPDRETLVKGPPAQRAFDAAGAPTPAAVGFARSRGIEVNELQVVEIDGGQYAAARVFEAGKPAIQLLASALPEWIAALNFTKSMRWNDSGVSFSRPIRWLLALFGQQVIPFRYAGLASASHTCGLRFRQPERTAVDSIAAYQAFLKAQGILLDPTERRAAILAQVQRLIAECGGDSQRVDDDLLNEVTGLVEAPTALRGSFDPSHLSLPAEVLTSVMQKYQRYFPVYQPDGSLMPYFIAIRNGDGQHLEVVADGNEQVIRARFADAAFFIHEDRKHRLEDFLPRLATLTFQIKLGSMLDKSRRIENLVDQLIPLAGISNEQAPAARRAARLCKADLVSNMVIEMTSLQGLIGRYYALKSGEEPIVAQAIYESYLPRFAGDSAPQSAAGLIVGMADRLDTLAGLFAAGLAPTGTKDPFAQRRAALGLVHNLIRWDMDFDLRRGLHAAAQGLPISASAESQQACLEFVTGRLQSYLLEEGWRYDIVAAVLAEQSANPASACRAVKQLQQWVTHPQWNQILPAYARCVRITRDQARSFPVQENLLVEAEEKALLDTLLKAENSLRRSGSVEDFFAVFLPMIPVINRFFDTVLVMAEDAAQRANRLGLLQRIASLAEGVADFSRLEGF